MKSNRFLAGVGLSILLFSLSLGVWAQDIRIASWNVQHLGLNDSKNVDAVAYVAASYDLLAVQEIMSQEGAEQLVEALEAVSEEEWGLLQSRLIGRGSYKESYAYLYRKSRVEYVDGAVVFVDHQGTYAREPFSARFRSADGASRWVMANIHVLYGDSRMDRVPEIRALADFWDWLRETFPNDRSFILAGDFNLSPADPAFQPLKSRAHPLIRRGATTLSSINGRYANLYDNLFLSKDHEFEVIDAGIDRFPARIGWTHNQARRHISDHAPVYVHLAADGPFPDRAQPSVPPRPGQGGRAVGNVSLTEPASVRGNRRSQIYHHPGCPDYDNISPGNRVPFEDEPAAQRSGYRRSRNCDWPED